MTGPVVPAAILPARVQQPSLPQVPGGAGAAQKGSSAAAQKFEAMAIAQFLKPMFASMGKADAPFGGGTVERQFKPFLINAIATSMEARGGLGLKPMIESAMRSAEATNVHATAAGGDDANTVRSGTVSSTSGDKS